MTTVSTTKLFDTGIPALPKTQPPERKNVCLRTKTPGHFTPKYGGDRLEDAQLRERRLDLRDG